MGDSQTVRSLFDCHNFKNDFSQLLLWMLDMGYKNDSFFLKLCPEEYHFWEIFIGVPERYYVVNYD